MSFYLSVIRKDLHSFLLLNDDSGHNFTAGFWPNTFKGNEKQGSNNHAKLENFLLKTFFPGEHEHNKIIDYIYGSFVLVMSALFIYNPFSYPIYKNLYKPLNLFSRHEENLGYKINFQETCSKDQPFNLLDCTEYHTFEVTALQYALANDKINEYANQSKIDLHYFPFENNCIDFIQDVLEHAQIVGSEHYTEYFDFQINDFGSHVVKGYALISEFREDLQAFMNDFFNLS